MYTVSKIRSVHDIIGSIRRQIFGSHLYTTETDRQTDR